MMTANSRLYGVYAQKQEGFFMQRVRVPGGRIGASHLRALAQIAMRFTPEAGLHLTTRQDIELHGVREADVLTVQTQLHEAGLSFVGAGGDSLRNITVCGQCEKCGGEDVYSIAVKLEENLSKLAFIRELPRKFKISFSGCLRACARPFINDLGFVARGDGSFDVIVAGSLGARPATGIKLFSALSAGHIEALCVAAVEMFAEMGDRTNRRAARLRHVRQRLGDEQFAAELRSRFESVLKRQVWPEIGRDCGAGKNRRVGVLNFPSGNIPCEDVMAFADAAEFAGATIYINLDHGFELFGERAVELGYLSKYSSMPRIVACPGSASCPNAITDSTGMGDMLRSDLQGVNTGDNAVRISACPNDCAQSGASGIGLIGLVRTIDGVRTQCYRIMTGGKEGTAALMAKEEAILPAGQVGQFIKSYSFGRGG